MKDLLELLSFIPQQFHKFYIDLNHSENEQCDDGNVVFISDESDNETVCDMV